MIYLYISSVVGELKSDEHICHSSRFYTALGTSVPIMLPPPPLQPLTTCHIFLPLTQIPRLSHLFLMCRVGGGGRAAGQEARFYSLKYLFLYLQRWELYT